MPKLRPEDEDKTDRLYMRLPKSSIAEINMCAERSGVTSGQFLALAMMIGTRALDRVLYPQGQYTPAVTDQIAGSMLDQISKMDKGALAQVMKVYGIDEE